jgi:hypothetical protein
MTIGDIDNLMIMETMDCAVVNVSSVCGHHEGRFIDKKGEEYCVVLDDASFAHSCRAMMYGKRVRVTHLVTVIE